MVEELSQHVEAFEKTKAKDAEVEDDQKVEATTNDKFLDAVPPFLEKAKVSHVVFVLGRWIIRYCILYSRPCSRAGWHRNPSQ